MTRVLRVGVAAIVVLLLASSGLAATRADTVTLVFSQYRNVNGVLVLVFSGTVSNGAAGEEVEVVGQDCGGQGYRLIGGARTRAGGGWQVQNPSSEPPIGRRRWTRA